MTKEQCRACGEWFEDSELDAHLSEHMNDEPLSEEEVEEEVEQVPQLPLKSPLPQGAELDRKGNLSGSTKYSPEEILSKADMQLRASGYDVRVQGSTLQALNEGHGREYQWAFFGLVLVTVLFLVQLVLSQLPLLWLISVPLFLYWWFANRGQNRIVLNASPGQFAIRYDGSTAFQDAEQLSNMLRE
jgi:hypothetical protein